MTAATRDLTEARHSLMEGSPVPMAELQGADQVVGYVNPAFCRLVGKSREALVGTAFAETAQEGDSCLAVLDRVYRTGEAETHTEPEHPGPHPAYWSYAMWPVLDAQERPVGVMMQVTETTEFRLQARAMNEALLISSVRQHELTQAAEKLNEQLEAEIADRKLANHALRESEERYRTLFDLNPVAVYSCDTSGVIEKFNRRATELWGREPASGDTDERFCGSYKLFRPDGSFMPHEQCPMAEVLSGKMSEANDAEVLIERSDGSRVTVIVNIRPLKNEGGGISGAINCFYDITDRKKHEEHQQMLLHELNHRVKNTLATVQSIAVQTLRNSQDINQARQQFERRLIALSKAHDTLTQEGWQGANLVKLVADAVLPYRNQEGDRFEIKGPYVWLPPKHALALAMGLHELCTNAVKYGALSKESGRVSIEWTLADTDAARELRIRWTETGGPPVMPPQRRGFGSRLVEHGLKQDLGGEVHIQFAATGVVCTIEVPLGGP